MYRMRAVADDLKENLSSVNFKLEKYVGTGKKCKLSLATCANSLAVFMPTTFTYDRKKISIVERKFYTIEINPTEKAHQDKGEFLQNGAKLFKGHKQEDYFIQQFADYSTFSDGDAESCSSHTIDMTSGNISSDFGIKEVQKPRDVEMQIVEKEEPSLPE